MDSNCKIPLRRAALVAMGLSVAILVLLFGNLIVTWSNGHLIEKGLFVYSALAMIAAGLCYSFTFNVGKPEVDSYLSVYKLWCFICAIVVGLGFTSLLIYTIETGKIWREQCPAVFAGTVTAANMTTTVAGFGFDYAGVLCLPANWLQFATTSWVVFGAMVLCLVLIGTMVWIALSGDLFNETLATAKAASEKYRLINSGEMTQGEADTHVNEILEQIGSDVDYEAVSDYLAKGSIDPLLTKIEETSGHGKKFMKKHNDLMEKKKKMASMPIEV